MKKALIAVIVVVVILLIIVGKGIGTYNNIIALEEGVKTQWAQVENTYQRRFDLIPNLVSTVQGEANFEKSTLTEVMDMRSRMGGTVKLDESLMNDEAALKRFQEMQGSLSGALQRLMAVSENYPDLKSNKSFQELRVQLEGAENRIAVERKRYNETVQAYNTTIRQFPTNLIAGFAGASPKALFSADAGASVAPKVQFDIK
ncbi:MULTISPECIES: LemA family protein [unclassified Fibrobacter]|jgi:LemA protein|uniref:LemA family protein n=1 Tax=unclassified Fibrobacter TaxID=2634177 RepID=UPI00091E476C|nr:MULTISPECIES: LemA family protein [unclassified Fibrobacter]MBP5441199.1 LemA family protein [Fibrobacter sp.]MBQ3776666.1 LemA family protein [Fibrobacter sp.]SHN01325.1 LemA protein [Fibrobacter sp. UWB7]SMG35878.1 LemA protein [Fibrobacter sp. UWB13]